MAALVLERTNDMAHVERFKRDWERGLIRYRIDSDYDEESITVEPKELLALLTWLQEHEAEITNDVLSNMAQEAAHEQTYGPAIMDERHPFFVPESED